MHPRRAASTQSPHPRSSVWAFVLLSAAVAGHLPGASAVLTAPVDAVSRVAADGTNLAALRKAAAAREKMHFWDGRCNPLRYRAWDYLSRDTTDLGDVQWEADDGFTLHNSSRVAADDDILWVRSSMFVAARYGAAWMRSGTAAGRSDVWVTYKRSLGELFLTHTELQKRYGESWYSFTQFSHWSFYKRTFEETTFPIVRDVRRPADLSSDEGRLAYTYGNEDAATAAFLRRGVQVVDLSSKTLVQLQLPGVAAPGVHSALAPTLAGDWCAMTLWDDAAKAPRVVLYDFAKKSWHQPVRQANAIGFNAFLWNATGTRVAEGFETQAYLLAWELERQKYPVSPLRLRRLEPASSDTHTYGLSLPLSDTKNVALRIVGLPSHASCLVPPSFWAVQGYNFTEPVYSAAAGGFVDVATAADFTVLRGALGAGHRVFLVLSSEGGGVEYFVVAVVLVGACDGGVVGGVAGLGACGRTVMADTVSREPIHLKSAHSSGVVFAVGSGPVETTWIAKVFKATDGSEAFGTCRVFDESDTAVGEVSVVADMMLYQQGPAADATAFRIMQADLDKDNDGSWDMVDRFPLAPDYQNDKDNDGIGDKQDLVDMRGRCRDHLRTNVGECASDLVVMYSAWGVFTFLLITIAASVGSYRKYFLDDLYSKRRAATREWIDRQWRETARQDIAEEELFQIMAEIDDKIQAQEGFRVCLTRCSLCRHAHTHAYTHAGRARGSNHPVPSHNHVCWPLDCFVVEFRNIFEGTCQPPFLPITLIYPPLSSDETHIMHVLRNDRNHQRTSTHTVRLNTGVDRPLHHNCLLRGSALPLDLPSRRRIQELQGLLHQELVRLPQSHHRHPWPDERWTTRASRRRKANPRSAYFQGMDTPSRQRLRAQ